MSDSRDFINALTDMMIDMNEVLLCNAETKKMLEESGEIPSNFYILEDNHIEKNQVIVVKDREMKRACIEAYEARKLKGGVEHG